jgi:hypothetical protein
LLGAVAAYELDQQIDSPVVGRNCARDDPKGIADPCLPSIVTSAADVIKPITRSHCEVLRRANAGWRLTARGAPVPAAHSSSPHQWRRIDDEAESSAIDNADATLEEEGLGLG